MMLTPAPVQASAVVLVQQTDFQEIDEFNIVHVADVKVRGHYRKNGTYVPPHTRTRPNKTKSDNYGCTKKGRC